MVSRSFVVCNSDTKATSLEVDELIDWLTTSR